MDGSCAGFDESLNDHDGADAFEAALEPLPTWDGVAYSAGGGYTNGSGSKNHAAAARLRGYEFPSIDQSVDSLTDVLQSPAGWTCRLHTEAWCWAESNTKNTSERMRSYWINLCFVPLVAYNV